MHRVILGIRALALTAPLAGCELVQAFDPCYTLAQRVCNCEPTPSARQSCVDIRISSQNLETTEAQRAVCQDALETCDCEDIDENRVEECGFTYE